jgi:hypothetical protein
MSQEHDTYLRFQDVFVTPFTFEQFEVELRSLGLGLVLRIFAAINVICSKRGPPRGQGTQVGLIRELFAPRDGQAGRRTFTYGISSSELHLMSEWIIMARAAE